MSLKAPTPKGHSPIASDNTAQSDQVQKKRSKQKQKVKKKQQDLCVSGDRFEQSKAASKHNKAQLKAAAKNLEQAAPDKAKALNSRPLHLMALQVTDDEKNKQTQALIAEQALLAMAEKRVHEKSRHYRYAAGWLSPNPIILGNESPDHKAVPGSRDQYKDAYLCLDMLFLAGIETPSIAVQADSPEQPSPGRWYPPALDWPDFAKNRSRLFNIVAVERMQGQGHKQRQRRLQKILPKAIGADLLVGEFVADDGISYGLAWLVLQSAAQDNDSVVALTANDQGAIIAEFPYAHFLRAESLQLLRPLRLRHDRNQDPGKLHAPAIRFS